MGIYSHLTTEQLTAKRDRLLQALEDRLTQPTAAGSPSGRNTRYDQNPEQLRKELAEVTSELQNRDGTSSRGPIYIV